MTSPHCHGSSKSAEAPFPRPEQTSTDSSGHAVDAQDNAPSPSSHDIKSTIPAFDGNGEMDKDSEAIPKHVETARELQEACDVLLKVMEEA